MRTAVSLLVLLSFSVAAPALAQGRGNDKGGNPGNAQNNDQGPGQGPGQGQGKGQGKGQGQTQGQNQGPGPTQGPGWNQGKGNSQANTPQASIVVTDRDRSAVQTYYRNQFAAGNCPPGLAKKNNGCLPPGQAKKLWAIGQPLPPSIVYYALPGVLLAQLTPPPMGYQYVRIDNDVLLMVIATRIIASAVANLGG